MVRVRPLTGRARSLAAACLAAALGPAAGCTTTKFATVQNAMKEAIAADEPAAAASQFACGWQNRLGMLPDPSRNGAMGPGLVGQVFLYTPDLKPAEVGGDLTVTVHDTTPRPQGAAPMRPEAWHFTKDVLKKMTVSDDRFGRSLVVFLPWPGQWKDVNRLYIQARYDQPGGQTLYAQPTTVTLDFSTPASGPTQSAGLPAVPDPAAMVRQAWAAQTPMTPGPKYVGHPPAGVQPVAYQPPANSPTAGQILPPNELLLPRR